MNEFIQRVKDQPAPYGSAVLWWLGQMGLLVKMGETVLCLDYFGTVIPERQVPPPVPAAEMEGIHAFLGTHNHLDHIDHACWQVWARTCPEAFFVFPAAHRQEVLSDGIGEERCLGLNDGGSGRVGDITIHAVAAAHEFLDRDPETGLYPCLQYIIEGNGLRIYHAGDTLRYEGMLLKLRAFGPIDAALLPINGRDGKRYRRDCIGNMTFQEAADLAGELDLRMAIPGHWDMFADNPGDPEAFADYMDAKYPGKTEVLIPQVRKPVFLQAGPERESSPDGKTRNR